MSFFILSKLFWQHFSGNTDWICTDEKAVPEFQTVSTELYSQ